MGQPEITWFGSIYHKQGMSPDPIKVDSIRAWLVPENKAAVKSFLQTVQFCAPYMRPDKGRTYADIISSLMQITAHGKHFKWTKECQSSFDDLKKLLKADTVFANRNPTKPTSGWMLKG